MDLSFVTDMFIPVVLVICIVVGIVLKNVLPIDNKYIPVIMAVLGAILACVNGGVTLNVIAAGLVTGLASTGLHQVFKQLLGLGDTEPAGESLETTEDDMMDEEDTDELIKADEDEAKALKEAGLQRKEMEK